jgi:membrane fusion protein (multidrug efflux system)
MRLSARINGQVEQVKAVEGQLVHAGDVLAVIEPTEYKIAVRRALARLAYAENTAASLYLTAAITTTTAYGGLNSANAAVKNAAGEKEAAKNLLQADQAVLEQLSAQDGRRRLVEAAVAQDQQEMLRVQGKLQQAAADLRTAQTAPQQVFLAKAQAHAADSQILQGKAELEQATQSHLHYYSLPGYCNRRQETRRNRAKFNRLAESNRHRVTRRRLDNGQLQRNATWPLKA